MGPAELARRIRDTFTSSVALIAIDGPDGAGKSTLARRLSAVLGDVPVVATDELGPWDSSPGWAERVVNKVIEPLAAGQPARYRRWDWGEHAFADLASVPPAAFVVIEGVSSARSEWAHRLAFTIWVDTPREVRLARGLGRDGVAALRRWEASMAAEDAHFAADRTRDRCDAVVSGLY